MFGFLVGKEYEYLSYRCMADCYVLLVEEVDNNDKPYIELQGGVCRFFQYGLDSTP
jgi:hypothetical protein